jgi:hypothetical protein
MLKQSRKVGSFSRVDIEIDSFGQKATAWAEFKFKAELKLINRKKKTNHNKLKCFSLIFSLVLGRLTSSQYILSTCISYGKFRTYQKSSKCKSLSKNCQNWKQIFFFKYGFKIRNSFGNTVYRNIFEIHIFQALTCRSNYLIKAHL